MNRDAGAIAVRLTLRAAGWRGPGRSLSFRGEQRDASVGSAAEVVPSDYFVEMDPEALFPGRGELPLELDLGCGDGGFLLDMARTFPRRNFLGVERVKGRVQLVAGKIRRSGLENVRILRLDAAYVVGWLLPACSVSRAYLLFPDPWPKKRHHKNRIVQSREFLAGLGRVLEPGGEFVHKTDEGDYFLEVREAMKVSSWAEEAGWGEGEGKRYPETEFERHWMAEGKAIHRGCWRRPESGSEGTDRGRLRASDWSGGSAAFDGGAA